MPLSKSNPLASEGLVADIDIESEKYRWMGSARLDFYVCIACTLRFLSYISLVTSYFSNIELVNMSILCRVPLT